MPSRLMENNAIGGVIKTNYACFVYLWHVGVLVTDLDESSGEILWRVNHRELPGASLLVFFGKLGLVRVVADNLPPWAVIPFAGPVDADILSAGEGRAVVALRRIAVGVKVTGRHRVIKLVVNSRCQQHVAVRSLLQAWHDSFEGYIITREIRVGIIAGHAGVGVG